MSFLDERRRTGEIPPRPPNERLKRFNEGQPAIYVHDDSHIRTSSHNNCLQGLLVNPLSDPAPETFTGSNLQKGCFAVVSGLCVTILRERPPNVSINGSVLTILRPSQNRDLYHRCESDQVCFTGYQVPGDTDHNPSGPLYFEVLEKLDDKQIAEVKDGGISEWDEGGPAEEVVTSVVGEDSKLFQPRQWNKVKVNCFDVPGSHCSAPPPSATMC
jgi:hypothetical protein